MTELLKGLGYNLTGISYFLKNNPLWKFLLLPFIFNFFLLVLLTTLYLNFFTDIFVLLSTPLGGMDIENPVGVFAHILDAGLWIIRNLFKILFFILSLVLIFMVVYLLSGVVNGPFYEAMAEKTLVLQGLASARPFRLKMLLKEFLLSLKLEGCKLLAFVGMTAILWLLSLIPLIGFVFTFLSFLCTAWLFAVGVCTYPMIIQGHTLKEIWRWAASHKALLMGFGLPLLIPFVGICILPLQVIGGTLLYVENKNPETL